MKVHCFRDNDLVVENLRFSPFYPQKFRLKFAEKIQFLYSSKIRDFSKTAISCAKCSGVAGTVVVN